MKKITLTSLLFCLALCAQSAFASQVTRVQIDSGWEFRQQNLDEWMPATVPGMVQADLQAQKKIPDPYYGDNWRNIQWVDKVNWEYRTTFDAPQAAADDQARMVFNGLDTYATVWLNGKKILEADNMFRTWTVDVKNIIKARDNKLHVLFYSPTVKGLEALTAFGLRLQGYNDWSEIGGIGANKLMFITRKPGCEYGWDLTPRMLTSGVWRPVVVESWNDARLEDLYVYTKSIDPKKAVLGAAVTVDAAQAGKYNVRLTLDGNTVKEFAADLKAGTNVLEDTFEVKSPRLWWPNGAGEPYLYDAVATLSKGDSNSGAAGAKGAVSNGGSGGATLDVASRKIGIRTTELVRIPDADGKGCSFGMKINGKNIFCKGSDWVACDVVMPRIKPTMFEFLVRSVADVNMNMMRVWGGAVYEDDHFYDMCDKYGIMLWHDFMFACGMYPDSPDFYANVKAEASDNLRRVRSHPSIVLWCGNNEVEVPWNPYGTTYEPSRWQNFYKKQSDRDRLTRAMERLFYGILDSMVRNTYSANMPYWHSSPSPGIKMGTDNPFRSGDHHYWRIWHAEKPIEDFNTNVGRFMSEYGLQSFPEMASMKRYTPAGDFSLHSPTMEAHQGSRDGNTVVVKYIARNFRVPQDFGHLVYMSQIMQAEALRTAMEAHRRSMPWCQGSLIWQINDDWPCNDWSTIDYYGYWKAAHYWMRKSCDNVLVAPYLHDGVLDLYVVSDLYQPLRGTLELTLMDFAGKQLRSLRVPVSVGAWSSTKVASYNAADLLAGQSSKNAVLSCALMAGKNQSYKALQYFEKTKDLDLPKPSVRFDVAAGADGKAVVRVSTDVLAKSVMAMYNGEAGIFTDNFFDLLPGESRTIGFIAGSPVGPASAPSVGDVKSGMSCITMADAE